MVLGKKRIFIMSRLAGKRIMITGGLGMLGSSVACKLVKNNHVTIVDSRIKPFGANIFNIQEIKDRVKIHRTDIRDKEAMKCLLRRQDIIFNFAAQVAHNDSLVDPFLDADINYFGTLNIMETLRELGQKPKILFSGSRLQFGRIEKTPVGENHPLRPLTPYGLNKTAAENLYLFYNRLYGIPCVIFRIANPYGIRCQMKHSRYAIVNYFIRQAMENKKITIYGDGEQLRDYIYVEDLAQAFIMAAASEKSDGEIFNVGSGIGTKFKDMVKAIVEVVGSGEVEFVPWPSKYANVETGDYVTDISKISKVLNWKPKNSLRDGIKKTHEYYKKYKTFYF